MSDPPKRRAALIAGAALAMVVFAAALAAIAGLEALPIAPAYSTQVMQASWWEGRPDEFEIRLRTAPRAEKPLGYRVGLPQPRLAGVESEGAQLAVSQVWVFQWARPNPGDISIVGKLQPTPAGSVSVSLEMRETHRLPWWRRLLPARWKQKEVEVRYPLSAGPIRVEPVDSPHARDAAAGAATQ
jgi:hypothetical protein